VEPVQSAGKTAERVPNEIMTLYVSELMKKNRATAIGAPRFAVSRKNDRRFEESACEWHLGVGTSKKPWRLFELETIRNFIEWCAPVGSIEWVTAPNDASHCERSVAEPYKKCECNTGPDDQRE
jgi:hypothetical protein